MTSPGVYWTLSARSCSGTVAFPLQPLVTETNCQCYRTASRSVNEGPTVLQSAASFRFHRNPIFKHSVMRLWSLPKVFHTCGKNCGKSRRSARVLSVLLDFAAFIREAQAANRVKSGLLA